MTETHVSGPGERYESFTALRVAHAEWSRALAADRASLDARTLQDFLARAAAAGTFIADEDERQRAQGILDFWSAELMGASNFLDVTPALLASYAPERAAKDGAAAAASEEKLDALRDESRQQIRLSATARLWRDSGRPAGYLLKGRALEEARRFSDSDEDIRELIRASEADVVEDALKEKRRMRRAVSVLSILVVFLMAALVVALLQHNQAQKSEAEARAAAKAEQEAKSRAETQAAAADGEARRAQAERNAALEAAARARDQVTQLEDKQKHLDAAMTVIRDGVQRGTIARGSLPPEIVAVLETTSSAPTALPLSDFDPALTGYDAAFLGDALPAPVLSAKLSAAAHDGGRPVNYVHYAVVLDAARRLAIFAASNLDRDYRVVLPRQRSSFALDPRVPPQVQPPASWFNQKPQIDRGHLVSRHEISWGAYFSGEPAEAAARLSRMTDIAPNTAPQFDDFNRGVWSDLERWIISEHNPAARRVSIFTGPVLAAKEFDGVAMPRAYWKIAVSRRSGVQQQAPKKAPRASTSGGLVVDAFMIPQFTPDGGKAGRLKFDPDVFRVGIRDIEQATGLDFGKLRDSDAHLRMVAASAQTEGASLAQRVASLDAATDTERKATAQQLVDVVRDQKLPDPEQRLVVAALLDMADEDSMLNLSATGRYNLLYVLSEIPQNSWGRPEWSALRADARVAVADLERRAAANQTEIGTQTRRWLDQLKTRIGLGKPMANTVYFQFAGMTREDAVAISERMQSLGWKIPGEERTGAAAGQNEVRYGAKADRDAAELLAADLKASGVTRMTGAKSNPKIDPGRLEIWVSR